MHSTRLHLRAMTLKSRWNPLLSYDPHIRFSIHMTSFTIMKLIKHFFVITGREADGLEKPCSWRHQQRWDCNTILSHGSGGFCNESDFGLETGEAMREVWGEMQFVSFPREAEMQRCRFVVRQGGKWHFSFWKADVEHVISIVCKIFVK